MDFTEAVDIPPWLNNANSNNAGLLNWQTEATAGQSFPFVSSATVMSSPHPAWQHVPPSGFNAELQAGSNDCHSSEGLTSYGDCSKRNSMVNQSQNKAICYQAANHHGQLSKQPEKPNLHRYLQQPHSGAVVRSRDNPEAAAGSGFAASDLSNNGFVKVSKMDCEWTAEGVCAGSQMTVEQSCQLPLDGHALPGKSVQDGNNSLYIQKEVNSSICKEERKVSSPSTLLPNLSNASIVRPKSGRAKTNAELKRQLMERREQQRLREQSTVNVACPTVQMQSVPAVLSSVTPQSPGTVSVVSSVLSSQESVATGQV